MARRVLADFDDELLIRIANRSDITMKQRGFFLDDGYRWTCSSYVHPEIEAETTGVQTAATDEVVPVATDIWWVEVVKNSDLGRNLFPGDKDEMENRTKQVGDPREYYWWSNRLRTEQKPSANVNYEIWYVKKVAELAAGQSPVIDQLFDPIIIMKAAQIGLSTVRDFKEALALSAEIERYSSSFNLPKRQDKKNNQRAGARVRMR